jgi:ketosteroid isomerase-like protein
LRQIHIAALVSFIAISALAPALTAADNDDKVIQQVKDFRNRYIEAEETKDIASLQQVLTDEFVAMNPQGQVLDKPHFLERIKDPGRKFSLSEPRDTQVHLYGNRTVAILTEHVTVTGNDNGRQFGGEFRFVRIFAKQRGKWQVALAQGTPMTASAR